MFSYNYHPASPNLTSYIIIIFTYYFVEINITSYQENANQ